MLELGFAVVLVLLITAWWVASSMNTTDDQPDQEIDDFFPAPVPPPDGTMSVCRLGGGCGNEIIYRNHRWEHVKGGKAACFKGAESEELLYG